MQKKPCCFGGLAEVEPENPASTIDELKGLGPEDRDDPMGTYFGEGDDVALMYQQFGV